MAYQDHFGTLTVFSGIQERVYIMKVSFKEEFLKNCFKLLWSCNLHTKIVLNTSMKDQMQFYQLLGFCQVTNHLANFLNHNDLCPVNISKMF